MSAVGCCACLLHIGMLQLIVGISVDTFWFLCDPPLFAQEVIAMWKEVLHQEVHPYLRRTSFRALHLANDNPGSKRPRWRIVFGTLHLSTLPNLKGLPHNYHIQIIFVRHTLSFQYVHSLGVYPFISRIRHASISSHITSVSKGEFVHQKQDGSCIHQAWQLMQNDC